MEKAILYKENHKYEMTKYNVIYIGDEFCSYKMINSIPKNKIKDKKYVLLTPIIEDRYINITKKIIENFSPQEITVNDLGFLFFLIRKKIKIKINIGRILIKLNFPSFNSKFWQDIMNNINAIEIDNNSIFEITKKLKVRIHFYLNYDYQSLTYNCIFKNIPFCFKSTYCNMYNEIYYQKKNKNYALFIKGNGYFIKNKLNDNIIKKEKFISRIIYSI